MAKSYSDAIIIAADTLVVLENKVLGKPHNPKKAKEMLSMLSGKTHLVITGFTIIDTISGKNVSETVETKIHFKKLMDEEINTYVASGEPLDKAGAYGIQGLGNKFIEKIEGSYSNVVGLPIKKALEVLKDFGV